eukprot:TRINITY_DN23152_c0_g1_i1.p1 TRINITY_DN23152_c0_g1~~TRINITY_DN23152_c0_g1_i1.p1  ORF type:complete len:805 (+),score=171.10 TRINITY_DN23152_c0_g1_i1:46-2460(+)
MMEEVLAAADGVPQPWNEVYQHPKAVARGEELRRRFATAQKFERRALDSGSVQLGGPAACGLSSAELKRYAQACGLDLDVGVGSLTLALNALPGVCTLSSCTSVHEGAHEEEALVAFTCEDASLAARIAAVASTAHFKASREDEVVREGKSNAAGRGKAAQRKRKRGQSVVARFRSYVIFSDACGADGRPDAPRRVGDLVRLAKRIFAELTEGDAESSGCPAQPAKGEAEAQLGPLHAQKTSLRAAFAAGAAKPGCAGNAMLTPAFPADWLAGVREELVANLRGLRGVETPESCALVRPLLVSGIVPASEDGDLAESLPRFAELLSLLSGSSFREALRCVAGCGPLDPRCTISIAALPQGGFWLPQRIAGDAIANGVGFTLFLVGDDWSSEDGGGFEVFGPASSSAEPAASAAPCFNRLMLFDASLYTAAPRVAAEHAPQLTIHGVFPLAASSAAAPLAAASLPTPSLAAPTSATAEASEPFGEADRAALRAAGVAARHLRPLKIEKVRKKFLEASSAKLPRFLAKRVAAALATTLADADAAGAGAAAVGGGWQSVGPACQRRFLRFAPASARAGTEAQGRKRRRLRRENAGNEEAANRCPAGEALQTLANALSANNGAFVRYLEAITGLGRRATASSTPLVPAVRRFRPGLDYARESEPTGEAVLDVILTLGRKREWQEMGAADVWVDSSRPRSSAAAGAAGAGGLLGGPEGALQQEDESPPLLRLAPVANALRVVLRDRRTAHLVEPISTYAPGSRWDLALELAVEGVPSDSEEEEGESEEVAEEEQEEDEGGDASGSEMSG